MKIFHKFCVAALLVLTLGGMQVMDAEVRYHVVEPGQTLYRISKYYGVTIDAILRANPKIEVTSVPTGTRLVIPEATTEPDKSIPLTPEEAVKQQAPAVKSEANAATKPAASSVSSGLTQLGSASAWTATDDSHWTDGTLNLAVIMPFNLGATSEADLNKQMRSVEFYEGVLMAVDRAQSRGRHVAVQTYDTGTQSVYSILAEQKLLSADLVIAPTEENEMRQVADWGESHGKPVVSPSVFNATMLETHQHLMQVNASKSMLYPQLTEELLSRFKGYTFVFLTDSVGKKKIDPYPAQLKEALQQHGLPFRELSYLQPERLMACDSILGLKSENLLFVPVTPSKEAMRRMFSGLQHVKILRDARYQAAILEGKKAAVLPELAVLGYPEWVQYTHDFIDYYYDLNVYMFTKVYANPFDPALKEFYTTFKQWYGKEPMTQLVPKYGLLGYDIANFFLDALSHNGQHLEERLESIDGDGLQTAFSFDHGTGLGFYNHGFYLVHFTPESTIEKITVQ